MKIKFFLVFILIVGASAAFAQTARPAAKARDEAEKQKILGVFNEYLAAMRQDQPERDRVRERLLTEDYVYLGVDGLPADKKLVMARQKRNGLKINSLVMSDVTIRLYENTAILTMRSAGAGVDKGQPWGGDGAENGHATVMVKQKGKWLVAADVVGRDVEK